MAGLGKELFELLRLRLESYDEMDKNLSIWKVFFKVFISIIQQLKHEGLWLQYKTFITSNYYETFMIVNTLSIFLIVLTK